MSTIGTIGVNVVAQTNNFTKGMAKVRSDVGLVNNSFQSLVTSAKKTLSTDLGKIFLGGLGIGSAEAILQGVGRAAGALVTKIREATAAGDSFGSGVARWAAEVLKLENAVSRLDERMVRERTSNQLFAQMEAFVNKQKGIEPAGGSDIIAAAMKNRAAVANQLAAAQNDLEHRFFTSLGAPGVNADLIKNLKLELKSLDQQIKMMGGMADQGNQIAKTAAANEKLKAVNDQLIQQGDQLAASLRTPFEVFEDAAGNAFMLLQEQVITWGEYQRAVESATGSLMAASKAKDRNARPATPGVGAVTRGTTAGFSAVQASTRELTAQLANQKQALALQKEENDLMKKAVASLAKIEAKPVATGTPLNI